ncbi:MAG TPA: hypothetical protein VLE51_02860 [Candidatus Saccharimonadales bacterium]|nr:hypothetical protein [Candidatus Saccharimonadales bacterium]
MTEINTPNTTLGSTFHPDELHKLDMFERRTTRTQELRDASKPSATRRVFDRIEDLRIGRVLAVGVVVGSMAIAGIKYNMSPADEFRAVFPDDSPQATQPAP